MRIIETWDESMAMRIDDTGSAALPDVDGRLAADGYNPITDDGERLGLWCGWIAGPNSGISYNQIR